MANLSCLPLLFALLSVSHASLIEQTWVISQKFVSPDGVEKLVPVVNGLYPGPTLTGHAGDRVRITVINRLPTETTSIHWHGIKQTGTPFHDGVPLVSQCPILPGDTYIYDFALNDEPGTLWWHSHSGFQKSSLFGAIIIRGDEDSVGQLAQCADDKLMLLNDWYHEDSDAQLAGLGQAPPNAFRWVGDAQSLLINGRGAYNCNSTVKKCNATHVDAGPEFIDVKAGETFRLRIVGASSLSFLNLGIDAHNLTIVEAETTLLKPFETDYLDLGAGQSYSALLRAKTREELDRTAPGHNGLFWIQANVRHRSKGVRGLAMLRYDFAEPLARKPSRVVPEDWPERDDTDWTLALARKMKSLDSVQVPKATRRFVYLGTQNRLTDGRLGWAMNNISYAEPASGTPVLHAAKFEIEGEMGSWVEQTQIPTVYNYSQSLGEADLSIIARKEQQIIKIAKDEVVDFVFQNTVTLGGVEEVHPWHLHLHNFWVLGYGHHKSTWSEADEASYDMTHAVSRNTMVLHPSSWTTVRFKADNPGAAHFHCHILAHVAMGMGMVVQIGEAKDIPALPQGTPFCGAGRLSASTPTYESAYRPRYGKTDKLPKTTTKDEVSSLSMRQSL